jgi:hypothetical protein
MRRLLVAAAGVLALPILYVLAHSALIEVGNEVVVVRTEEPDGTWHDSRLWIVDDAGHAWLHGDRRSRWMRNLESRPIVEIVRGGEAARYRATQVPGPRASSSPWRPSAAVLTTNPFSRNARPTNVCASRSSST